MDTGETIKCFKNTYNSRVPFLLLLLVLIRPNWVLTQEPKVSCRFLSDSLRLAEPCTLRLSIQISPGSRLELNDGIAAFYPFTLLESFTLDPIRREGVDWHVYEYVLQSFVVGNMDELGIQYSVITRMDTQSFTLSCLPPPYVSELKKGDKDSLNFQYKQEFIPLLSPPNYYEILGKASLVLLALGIGYMLMRRPLQKLLRLLSTQREWKDFRRAWGANEDRIGQQELFISYHNKLWKYYLDPEDQWHLRSLSTPELAKRVGGIPFLSTPERQELLRAAQLENDIVHAGRQTDLRTLKESQQNIFHILKKAYGLRKKEVWRSGEDVTEG